MSGPEPTDIVKQIKALGIPGGLCMLGVVTGTSGEKWIESYKEDVSALGLRMIQVGFAWIILIFVGRLTGLAWLRRLDG